MAQKTNSKTTMYSSSIKLSKELDFPNSFLNFQQMEMEEFKTSLNSQWSLDWLKTQENTIKDRTLRGVMSKEEAFM